MVSDMSDCQDEKIITFTDEEKVLVEEVFSQIAHLSDVSYGRVKRKLEDLEGVALSISKYPSIKATSQLAGRMRDGDSLIEALCRVNSDSRLLSLPTKTVLGKAYMVAKFHTFVAFMKVGESLQLEANILLRLKETIFNIMFTIMAEDVYVSLLESNLLVSNVRECVARSLADLWESRLDKHTTHFSSILTTIWNARARIAPVFGTMLGTSEFFSFSGYVGAKWAHFISRKLKIKEVMWALEEFLFGISYEEIRFVREKLEEEKIESVSREEVFGMLDKIDSFKESDVRSFYASYSERRNNADARKRLKVEGPKNILEDYCVLSLFENKDIQIT